MNTKKQLTVKEFKKDFCTTLETDTNGQRFVKVPVKDYCHLNYMTYYLTHAIELISQAHEYNTQKEDLSYTLTHISHILKAFTLGAESEGLDKL